MAGHHGPAMSIAASTLRPVPRGPLWALKGGPPDDSGARSDEHVTDRTAERRRVLVCRSCGQVLARADHRFTMGDRAIEAFVNPAGYMHELLTVHHADGVVLVGAPTAVATWFPGYAWQIAHCAGCAVHVGWQWMGGPDSQPSMFVGLLTRQVVERDAG